LGRWSPIFSLPLAPVKGYSPSSVTPTPSRLGGSLRVGAAFFVERGALVTADPAPCGLVNRLADLAHAGIDVGRVHPAIAVFFEDTAALELRIESRWRFPFSIAWRIARPFMRWIGQFVLPLGEARVLTRVMAIDARRDGRASARAVLRTYADTGEIMQVVAYATWEQGGARYMSAAFPLPGGQILGILRLDPIGDEGAVALTSARRDGDDAGVRAVIGGVAIRAPLGEHLEMWAPGMRGAPADLDPSAFEGATIVARHEQRIFGVRFVTHRYWFRPRDHRP
jgi:hypothetical protein